MLQGSSAIRSPSFDRLNKVGSVLTGIGLDHWEPITLKASAIYCIFHPIQASNPQAMVAKM